MRKYFQSVLKNIFYTLTVILATQKLFYVEKMPCKYIFRKPLYFKYKTYVINLYIYVIGA